MKKPKILIITHTFPTKHYPIGAIFLQNQLEELRKSCDIRIIFPHGYVPNVKFLNPYFRFSNVPDFEEYAGFPVYHPKYFMIPRAIFHLKLLHIYLSIESYFSFLSSKNIAEKLMQQWKPDIIHSHGTVSESHIALMLRRKYKKPLVVTVYGEDVTRYAKQPVARGLSKKILEGADVVISQSRFLENEIKKSKIHVKKCEIIPMGAKLGVFTPKDKIKMRKKLGLSTGKRTILFVGHLTERKGVEYLIRSMEKIKTAQPDAICCIIGGGQSESSLKKLAGELNLEDNVVFLGIKKNKEVGDYMNACDLFVLPSLNEGLPVVLCEALACGKPVVATNVAGTPEIVDDDVGFLVEPKDPAGLSEKILLALNKKWDRRKLLNRARDFSTKSSAKKVLSVYKELIAKSS